MFSAVALFPVFGFGLLLEEVGLSMAMGAFLAGVLLASSEYRHALESDIEPFKDCCWGCSLSASACRLISAPGHPSAAYCDFAGRFPGDKNADAVAYRRAAWRTARPAPLVCGAAGAGSEFAFVVFGAARMADVLDGEWAKR